MNLADAFSLIAAIHGVFLAILLKRFSGIASNNLFLVILLIAIALCLCADLWMYSAISYTYPQLSQLLSPVYLVIGPLLFLYTKTTLQNPPTRKFVTCLHFLPSIIFYGFIFLINILVSTEDLRNALINDKEINGIDGFGIIIQLHIGIYIFASYWEWLKFEKAVKTEYSADIALVIQWLKHALIIFFLMWSVWVAGSILLDSSLVVLTDLAMIIGVYFLGYSALLHKNVLLPSLKFASVNDDSKIVTQNIFDRYARAKLTSDRITQLKQKLSDLMLIEHSYLEPELTLSQLAELLHATNHETSQLLNEELGESFFDFINRHRVSEVQRCLHDSNYDKQTILDIALASGFSSKAAFNAAFKKLSGMTPSQYKALRQ